MNSTVSPSQPKRFPGLRFLRRGADPFSPERHFRQTDAGVRAPSSGKAEYWLLARSQYRVRVLTLANVAANRREAAIQLEMSTWNPFARSGHYAIPQADGALLMAWDADLVESAMTAQGVTKDELSVAPENAFRALPADGLQIKQCLEGMEATISAEGSVRMSLWWPEPPSEQEWANFLRTSGLPAEGRPAKPPEPVMPAWLPQPLGYSEGKRSLLFSAQELQAFAAIVFLLLLATLWAANDWRRYAVAQSNSEERLRSTEKDLEGILGARGTAVGSRTRAEKLGELFNRGQALNLLANLSRLLSTVAKPGSLQVSEFDWRDHRVILVLQSTGEPPAATRIVKALESYPGFHDVQVNGEGLRTRVELRVDDAIPDPATPASTTSPVPAPPAPSGAPK